MGIISIIFGFLLGTILGSFCSVLANRSLTKKSFWGRSYCEKCKKTLQWYDLFPVFSFLYLKGKCRSCKTPIKKELLIVELTMGLLISFLFWLTFNSYTPSFDINFLVIILHLIFKIFFLVILVPLFIVDLKTMFLPDRIVLPGIVIGFFFNLLLVITKIIILFLSLKTSSLGKYLLPPYSEYFFRHAFYIVEPFLYAKLTAILIGGFFLGLIILTRGRGMGGGDVKLGAFIGLMLGFSNGILAIFLSFFIGAIFSVFLLITGKKSFGQAIPFGPFLVIGSIISLFFGSEIINWYLQLGI